MIGSLHTHSTSNSTTNSKYQTNRIRPKAALRAIAALMKDPEDTSKVFTIVQSLSGKTPVRMWRRFSKHPQAQRLINERPEILPILADREALRRMPEGSLAHAYLAFVESEGITADGLVEASVEGHHGVEDMDPNYAWLKRRMRDTHDLWHTVLGYKGDIVGEASILAFTLVQSRNPGVAVIVLAALHRFGQGEGRAKIIEGFKRGLSSEWLPAQDWENLLPLPLETVRKQLKIDSPPIYTPIRPAELRAQGILS
jgi:ubiquinone biosynthesis protein COQ4